MCSKFGDFLYILYFIPTPHFCLHKQICCQFDENQLGHRGESQHLPLLSEKIFRTNFVSKIRYAVETTMQD